MTNASLAVAAAAAAPDMTDRVQATVLHHVADSHVFELPGGFALQLPPWLSVHAIMVVLAAVLLTTLLWAACRRYSGVPRGPALALELFVLFVRDKIATAYLGKEDGPAFTPFFCTLFLFILTMNLIGLVPCFRTPTGNVNVTGALALLVLGTMIIGSVWRHGLLGFFKTFIPHGVPWPVLFVLVPIEFIGLFIKAFALMIRLFANMLAGHIVLLSLLGLVIIFGAAGLPAVVMALAIDLMEVGVAILQAYIFTLLSAVFIGQTLHPEH